MAVSSNYFHNCICLARNLFQNDWFLTVHFLLFGLPLDSSTQGNKSCVVGCSVFFSQRVLSQVAFNLLFSSLGQSVFRCWSHLIISIHCFFVLCNSRQLDISLFSSPLFAFFCWHCFLVCTSYSPSPIEVIYEDISSLTHEIDTAWPANEKQKKIKHSNGVKKSYSTCAVIFQHP